MNGCLVNIYKSILKREPTEHEKRRDAHLTQKQLIYNLANCVEKFKQLRMLSGESMKTKIKYSEEDIQDFFSSNDYSVALCLSGHVRNYEKNLRNINKFLVKPLNADVFIHTWDSVGTQVKITKNTVGPIPDESNKDIPNFNDYLLNVRKIKIDNNHDFLNNFNSSCEYYLYGMSLKEDYFGGQAEPKYIYSQLYSVHQSFELLEKYSKASNKKYDIVIKLRADYSPQSGIEPSDFEKIIETDSIFIPNTPYSNHGHPACCLCEAGIEHDHHVEDICDVFAYSTYEKMKKYFEMYFNLDHLNLEQSRLNKEMISKDKYYVEKHKNYHLVDIWKDRNYMLNCFYPERLFKMYLKDDKLLPSKLCGEVVR
tara:strand:- start:1165 stop:2268 length:1104 start_codon:yes stop_codon:yes gene_type:complete